MSHGYTIEPPPPHVDCDYQGVCFAYGLVLLIENLAGSTRSGVGEDGHRWSTKMYCHYGEIDGTHGSDNEPVDFYLNPVDEGEFAFIIQQKVLEEDETGEAPPGSYDEAKVMIGFSDEKFAVDAWRAHYDCNLPDPHVIKVRNHLLREWLTENLYMDVKDQTQQITGWT